ncbi:glycosyltransferase involved in cell wall biosynthesis [Streptosporangium becharense]|uniref:Glycosyltransferase involved in cell wall biosynthesis n=1 Tax=Streptosporangium becharense TaxID=1816182 RepID=A0A7W9ME70_9ACTN|nr:glycosyltransferase family 4 protein [Streptosporangium becharense]MBB2913581.1 glycosyltransferase involved in cell wall biosynthesis [Streptosporangium becharense]MBB5817662.1 glycosyltransferase involved in cell wall biosynthesis [Streptosporangium becharense]
MVRGTVHQAAARGRVTGLRAAVRPAKKVAARGALWLLNVLNARRALHAPAPDAGTVRILLQHAYGMGGTIRTVLNLAGYLARERDVEIVSVVRVAKEPFFPLPPGVRVSFLDDRVGRRGPLARLLSRFPSMLTPPQENVYKAVSLWTDLRLLGFLRSMRNGVVISTRPGLNLITALFAPPGVITIGQEHVALDMHSPEVVRLIKRRYGRFDAFVTLTQADLDRYTRTLKNPPARLLRIPNAVPPLKGDLSKLEDKSVVAIGRIVHAKGFDLLVKAWKQVSAAHPDWVLRIYGRGKAEAEARLRARIEEAGLSGSVVLMGSSTEIGAELAKSSIHVVSSRYEGFSMTILEAMSKGVPTVSFRCPHGPGEIITHEHDGLLVPPKKPAALAEAICRLIEDRELRHRLGRNSTLTAAQYDLDVVGACWDRLLSDLAGRPSRQNGPAAEAAPTPATRDMQPV